MKQRVTRNDVARRAGVSTAVVSYVMNNAPPPVSVETRDRVLKAIDDLSYRANHIARSLRLQRTNTLGILISDSTNPYYGEVVKGIEVKAFDLGYSILVGNTSNNIECERTYLDSFISRKVDGIIFVSSVLSMETMKLLDEYNIPAIYIGSDGDLEPQIQSSMNSILFTDKKGGYEIGRHLLERGHKRMACIVGGLQVYPFAEIHWLRLTGFSQALSEANLHPQVIRLGDTFTDGYQAAMSLLKSKNPPTAIFACNDLVAIGVLRAAADLDIKVPDKLAVCGFDDIEVSSYVNPRLTTIRIPKEEIAEQAVRILIEHIDAQAGKPDDEVSDLPVEMLYYETILVVREST